MRLATLAPSGRITLDQVRQEVTDLKTRWAAASVHDEAMVGRVLSGAALAELDRFDRVQLDDVLRVCRECSSLSAAGRRLFDRSRDRKKVANDADRLRKYLARFGLDWTTVQERLRPDS